MHPRSGSGANESVGVFIYTRWKEEREVREREKEEGLGGKRCVDKFLQFRTLNVVNG